MSTTAPANSNRFITASRLASWERWAFIYLRLALGAAFLSGIADRFGIWRGRNVGYGNFQGFVQYTAKVNSFMPAPAIPFLAWAATVAEFAFGIAASLFRIRPPPQPTRQQRLLCCDYMLGRTKTTITIKLKQHLRYLLRWPSNMGCSPGRTELPLLYSHNHIRR